jgi:hypothetical protein
MVLCYYLVNNYIIYSYQKYAASALAVKVFIRSGGGAAFPLFITQMYGRLGLQWANWLLAFISLAMAIIPFSFYRYGGTFRETLTLKKKLSRPRKAMHQSTPPVWAEILNSYLDMEK